MTGPVFALIGLAVIVGAVLLARRAGLRAGRSEFLCDDCRLDDPRLCSRRERPNATECPDYSPR